MTIQNYNLLKQEIVYLLRNGDVFTTSEREVSTTSTTRVLNNDSSLLINVGNVKNIRSLTIGSNSLKLYTDYDLDITFNDSGSIKTLVTFKTPQTGSYEVVYDYGKDKIFPDLPKPEIKISSFPRIGIDIIGEDSEDNELSGNSELVNISFSIIVYRNKTWDIDEIIHKIKTLIFNNKKTLYNARYIKKLSSGPITKFIDGKEKIFQRNIDYISILNEEMN